ncbi:MAG: hypothetical protein MK207_05785 [Saprospiraceae bacterium]|nr:hypothetical protein [Saprospiraceae bacterium]
MNKFIIFVLICLSITCIRNNEATLFKISNQEKSSEPFEVKLEIEKLTDNIYSLNTTIKPDSGNYIISPFAQDTFYGLFELSINESERFIYSDSII